MTRPIALRCYVCQYKTLRSREGPRIGDTCPNPAINCYGKLEIDGRPDKPGYPNQSQGERDGSHT